MLQKILYLPLQIFKPLNGVLMKNSLFICSCLFLLLNTGCDPEFCYRKLYFEIPFKISPAIDTFNIGDTIWLESDIDSLLLDSLTQEYIDVSDFEFKIEADLARMDSTQFIYSANDFKYVNVYGSLELAYTSSFSYLNIKYINIEGNKKIKVGIIPEKKGLFCISFGMVDDNYTNVEIIKDDCSEAFDPKFTMNNGNGADNNYALFTADVLSPGSLFQFEHSGSYGFYVK